MEVVVKTLHGLEGVLAKEIEAIGGKNIKKRKRAVACKGNLEFVYSANLNLRTALKVLLPIYSFNARSESELYNKIKSHDWSKYMSVQQTFAIDNTVFSEFFRHSKYASLKMKDAIVDQFREKERVRPSIDTDRPDVLFNLHAYKDQFTVSLDSSGKPLNQRGYRNKGHAAPLNEVLAAGLLMLAGWNKTIPLIDPMCGSGTIITEAALMGTNTPPQISRNDFGFRNWNSFEPLIWSRVKSTARANIRNAPLKILGGDIDGKAVRLAKGALREIGAGREVQVKQVSFEDQRPIGEKGMLITNPPYGERIGSEIHDLYKKLGDTLKQKFVNYDAWILSSNSKALKRLHLKPTEKIELFNGSLETQFCKYELYSGSQEG